MISIRALLTVCWIFVFGKEVISIQVSLVVDPETPRRGDTLVLRCDHDLGGLPLYTVKWYRGTHEFYRYSPTETKVFNTFPTADIFIDTVNSTEKQVVLKNVSLGMAGNYSCEVTADSPSFRNGCDIKIIEVVEPPVEAPVLEIPGRYYSPGDILKANCTSFPSRPAANITFYLNDIPVPSGRTSLHHLDNGLRWTAAHVSLRLRPDSFVHGRLRLRCAASIYRIYAESASREFVTPDVDPRPERIMLYGGSSSSSLHVAIFLTSLAVVTQCFIRSTSDFLSKTPGYHLGTRH